MWTPFSVMFQIVLHVCVVKLLNKQSLNELSLNIPFILSEISIVHEQHYEFEFKYLNNPFFNKIFFFKPFGLCLFVDNKCVRWTHKTLFCMRAISGYKNTVANWLLPNVLDGIGKFLQQIFIRIMHIYGHIPALKMSSLLLFFFSCIIKEENLPFYD